MEEKRSQKGLNIFRIRVTIRQRKSLGFYTEAMGILCVTFSCFWPHLTTCFDYFAKRNTRNIRNYLHYLYCLVYKIGLNGLKSARKTMGPQLGGRGHKFKFCHSDRNSVEIAMLLHYFLFLWRNFVSFFYVFQYIIICWKYDIKQHS